MAFHIGENLILTNLNGKKEKVTVFKRAVDYEDHNINEFNFKGKFDYIVLAKRNGKEETVFCQEKELMKMN